MSLTHAETLLTPLGHAMSDYVSRTPAQRRAVVRVARRAFTTYRTRFGLGCAPTWVLTRPESQVKIGKSEVPTLTLMLTPATSLHAYGLAKVNACPAATSCADVCLAGSGKGELEATQRARICRHMFTLAHPYHMGILLARDLISFLALNPEGIGFRFNCVSDYRIERIMPEVIRRYSRLGVTWYDYTAYSPHLRDDLGGTYDITYSAKETHGPEYVAAVLGGGFNVALPFAVGRGGALPSTWHGMPVIDGDKSDFRPGDARGVIVGLRAKGRAWRSDTSGFFRVA